MRVLVFEFRMVDYAYFLDKLQPYEVQNLLECIPYADRPQWEQTRLKIFSTASMFSKSQLSVRDIMKFPWESEPDEPEPDTAPPTDTERERLKRQADQIIKNMKENPDGTGL